MDKLEKLFYSFTFTYCSLVLFCKYCKIKMYTMTTNFFLLCHCKSLKRVMNMFVYLSHLRYRLQSQFQFVYSLLYTKYDL